MKHNYDLPKQLNTPRAWRTYLGGSLIDKLHGNDAGADDHFPEEWIMSVISARNAGREHITDEGLAYFADEPTLSLKEYIAADPETVLGAAHVAHSGAHPGVLVKLIDSSERLTIQVHPDRTKAQELFHAPYGKTECWHILGGRTIDGEAPCVYLGFKPGVTREMWKHLFDVQDIPGMLACMHRYDVKKGDTILIEGGVPHAIGAGCFLVEIQEPTDYTIRVERTTPSGFAVADSACHQGLGFDTMFDCFHYDGLSRVETQSRWFLPARTVSVDENAAVTTLVGYEDTKFFAMRRLLVSGKHEVKTENFCALYVLSGKGSLTCGDTTLELCAPQQYFVPAGCSEFTLIADGEMEVMQFFGPEA